MKEFMIAISNFFRRLFAKKATEMELVCGYAKIDGGLRYTRNMLEVRLATEQKRTYELQQKVSRLERYLNNSFVLVVGKDDLRAEASDLETELYGRDASESKELHDKLVRLSVVRAKLRDKNIPPKTHYKITHAIYEEQPEGGQRMYEPEKAMPTGGEDRECLRVLQTPQKEGDCQTDEKEAVP